MGRTAGEGDKVHYVHCTDEQTEAQKRTCRQAGTVLAPASWLLTPVEPFPAASLPCWALSPTTCLSLTPHLCFQLHGSKPDVLTLLHPSPWPSSH